jgi:hypothetical protein
VAISRIRDIISSLLLCFIADSKRTLTLHKRSTNKYYGIK